MGMSVSTIRNKKAKKNYIFLDDFTAGIQLVGSEIKSIREGEVNINDAYCIVEDGELYVKDMYVKEYKQASYLNHEPKRMRKLLLSKKELKKILKSLKPGTTGITVVPISLFINERGWAKLNIAISRGKKDYDKRQDIKARDIDLNTQRTLKNYK
ncbi:MAG: SsrA-binding protein [uncultured marine phage]|uniref:SsrA-binding protein n=1 Tax=uncultured marine phage TaxID=707152 RepID=A0A8D9CDM8_9VIRU|nr:MAG: SsrA-binding protein [uncultured marine phage]